MQHRVSVLTHICLLFVDQTHTVGISCACECVVNAKHVYVLDALLLKQVKDARSAL